MVEEVAGTRLRNVFLGHYLRLIYFLTILNYPQHGVGRVGIVIGFFPFYLFYSTLAKVGS